MTYVLEHTFGTEANAEFDTQFQRDSGKWYGINQYFFTEVSPTLTTGMRVEWFRDQDNTRVLQIPVRIGGQRRQLRGPHAGFELATKLQSDCSTGDSL